MLIFRKWFAIEVFEAKKNLGFKTREKEIVTNECISKASLLKISPRPSLPKRGTFPPFGKGRIGGILQSMSSYL